MAHLFGGKNSLYGRRDSSDLIASPPGLGNLSNRPIDLKLVSGFFENHGYHRRHSTMDCAFLSYYPVFNCINLTHRCTYCHSTTYHARPF